MAETAVSHGMEANPVSKPAKIAFKKAVMFYTVVYVYAHIHIIWSQNHTSYFFQWRMWSLSSPQLLLRRGESKKGPMVNFAKYHPLSRTILLGKGDYTKQPKSQLAWGELRRDKNFLRRSDYHFTTAEGSKTGDKVTFRWRKNKQKFLRTVYNCVDEDGREVARLFSGGMVNVAKAAEIDLLMGLDRGLEELLLMSALAVWAMESFDLMSEMVMDSSGDPYESYATTKYERARRCFRVSVDSASGRPPRNCGSYESKSTETAGNNPSKPVAGEFGGRDGAVSEAPMEPLGANAAVLEASTPALVRFRRGQLSEKMAKYRVKGRGSSLAGS
ncbi:hypothetical protein DL767_001361 [Monosporascus sp. MG133]|nr:hypothetical protein DL767_001361 [Monosporascus sp. MG133]